MTRLTADKLLERRITKICKERLPSETMNVKDVLSHEKKYVIDGLDLKILMEDAYFAGQESAFGLSSSVSLG